MKYKVFTNSFRSINRSVSKKLFILFLIVFGFSTAKAQVYLSVGAGKKIFSIQDTVCYSPLNSAADYYYIYVKNTGTSAFAGTVYLNIAVDSTMTGNSYTNTLPVDSFLNSMILPGDSTVLSHTQLYDTSSVGPSGSYYRMGGNIVVIWPSASGAITVDSSEVDTVNLINCMGVNEIMDDHGLSVFPNPCTDIVSLQVKGSAAIATIGIFNLQGELLSSYKNTNTLSFADLSAGMYFLKVEFADKTSHTYKIIRK